MFAIAGSAPGLWPTGSPVRSPVCGRDVARTDDQEVVEKWRTNRGLRPAIRTCSTSGDVEGAARAAEDDQTVAPSLNVVKHVCVRRPSMVARKRIAIRALKAVSRAWRGRSGNHECAEHLERASCEPHNDCATAEDRDMDLRAFNAVLMLECDDDLSG